jgi:hypothetical protein
MKKLIIGVALFGFALSLNAEVITSKTWLSPQIKKAEQIVEAKNAENTKAAAPKQKPAKAQAVPADIAEAIDGVYAAAKLRSSAGYEGYYAFDAYLFDKPVMLDNVSIYQKDFGLKTSGFPRKNGDLESAVKDCLRFAQSKFGDVSDASVLLFISRLDDESYNAGEIAGVPALVAVVSYDDAGRPQLDDNSFCLYTNF